jgi:hypothetical protein
MKVFNAQQVLKEFPNELRKYIWDSRDNLMMVVTNEFCIDLPKLDDTLARHDKEYDHKNCTYKGEENVSMSGYIKAKYGEDISNTIEKLM